MREEALVRHLLMQRQGLARGQASNGPYMNGGFQQSLAGNSLAQVCFVSAIGFSIAGCLASTKVDLCFD